MADVKLFLSCVSDEFGAYRESLRHALTRPSVEIKIQEDFHALGEYTLAMLETYVEGGEVVIHFIGDMAGSAPRAASVDDLLKRRPELAAQLEGQGPGARGARRLRLYPMGGMARPSASTRTAPKRTSSLSRQPRACRDGESFKPTDASRASQAEHLRRLRACWPDAPRPAPTISRSRSSLRRSTTR